MRIPAEAIYRHAFQEAARYFAGKIEEKRRNGFVAVLVEDFYESLFFLPCNENGYPDYYQLKALELPRLEAFLVESDIPLTTTVTAYETTIIIEKPMLSYRYDYNDYPVVFMWSGKKIDKQSIPIEKLNVSELLRVAQTAIKNREGLIIDEALKNKIYK